MGWTSAALRHHRLSRFLSSPKQIPFSFLQPTLSSLPPNPRNCRCCFLLRCRLLSAWRETPPSDTSVTGTKPRAFLKGSRKRSFAGYGIGRGSGSGGVRRTETSDVHSGAARVAHIVEIGGEDMERELNSNIGTNLLSCQLISEVICVLSARGVSALRFFRWVRAAQRGYFSTSPDIYNRLIDNMGRLRDYGSMLLVLQEMSFLNYYLTENAFDFLKVLSVEEAKFSALKMIGFLNEVGGQCRGSGMHSLIRFLCSMKAFDLAVSMVQEAARKVSLYNIILAAKCRHGDFEGARDLLEIMRSSGCCPTTTSYNYILGSLFKNKRTSEGCELLRTMKGLGYMPDEVTYEIIILQACSVKKLDYAVEMLHLMLSSGLQPRFATHAVLVKGYFLIEGMAKAHKYVVAMSVKDRCSTNMNYSLLVNLFLISGRVTEAGSILNEMMEKGLKPNFPVYVKTMKDLHCLGMGGHATRLAHKFSLLAKPTYIG